MSDGKVVASFAEAVADIGDGSTVIVGGFGLCGIPEGGVTLDKLREHTEASFSVAPGVKTP